jgi:signal transduction histidine kinase
MVRARSRPFLFLAALILPCVAIVVLVLMLKQDPILTATLQSRSRDAIASALFGDLQSIMVGELAGSLERISKYSDPSVVLVASISRNSLDLPWDLDANYQTQDGSTERDLGNSLKKDFPLLDLRHGEWKAYPSYGVLLSVTPPMGDAGRQLLIAVRVDEIVDRVRQEQNANVTSQASKFIIEPIPAECKIDRTDETQLGNCDWPLDTKLFPDLQVHFPTRDPGFQQNLDSFRVAVLGLVIAFTFVFGFFSWRDTTRKVRIAEMRSHFVSNVSHELRTPLTNIRMFAETLEVRGSTNPRMQDEYLGTIIHETERLSRLVNNILDFSSIENDQKLYRPTLNQLNDVARSAADTMQFMLSTQQFSLVVDLCAGLPPMLIDRDAMKQAVLNLLSNAMKYSGSSRTIVLRLRRDDEFAYIEVLDYGTGIDPKEISHIFKKFYRVATPENRAITGAGLGLTIVAHIAEAHGGSVYVQSTPGKGTTFSIRLPLQGGSQL